MPLLSVGSGLAEGIKHKYKYQTNGSRHLNRPTAHTVKSGFAVSGVERYLGSIVQVI